FSGRTSARLARLVIALALAAGSWRSRVRLLPRVRAAARQRRRTGLGLTTYRYRSRGAETGGRRHRREMTGVENVRAGARRARPGGAHIGDHRDRGCEDRANDVAHGAVEPAGGVHLEHHEPGAVVLCRLDTVHDIT